MESSVVKKLLLVLGLFVCWEITDAKHVNISCPTEFCTCKKEYAKCLSHGKNLTFIPKLPDYVKHVIFDGNFLPNVTKLSLWPLKYLNLTTLHMENNGIRNISFDAFEKLKNLFYLDLSGNKDLTTTTLMNAFPSLVRTKIAMLILNGMDWTTIPPKMFYSLRKNKIIRIDINENMLSTFDMSDWSYLKYLSHFDISNNGLAKLTTNEFAKLKQLLLNQNSLNEMPQFCSRHGPYLPRLETLELKYNSISHLNMKTFDCLPKLKNLLLDKNPISKILNNTFSILPRLLYLGLTSLTRKVQVIEPYAFNSSSLLKLAFEQNKFDFFKNTYEPRTIFKACPNLVHLDLTGNNVPQDSDILIEMMKPLKHLNKLVLQAVKWRNIPSTFLTMFPVLETLILSGNYISIWDNTSFANVTTMEYLDLSSNNINLINKTSFPPEVLKSLKHLNLAKNPFTCTCDLRWFRNWIKSVNFSLHPYPDFYKCISPPAWKGKFLEDFNPTEESCTPKTANPLEMVAISSSAAGLVLIVSVILIYKCRWHIRYGLYLLRSKRRGYIRIMNEESFKYDAFVIYSEDDRTWVHDKFLKRMEEEEELSLCIHFRDFEVGKLVVDNISDSIKVSRKVCVILSNNFAKSQWCKFELLLAQDRFLNEGTDVLVIVMLEEIEHRYLSGALKTLLTSTTYAVWSQEQVAEALFWEQVITAFRNPLKYNELNA